MEIVFCACISFVLDLIFGDPRWLLHTVVIMGRAIEFLERNLRKTFPKTEKGEFAAGVVMAALLPVLVLVCSLLILWGLSFIHMYVAMAVAIFWGWQCLAIKDLRRESLKVKDELDRGDLKGARKAVSRIVGRDTDNLTETGVAKAAVETVAESFSDGIIAPLFYMMIGGAPLALVYKSVNTMDSMVGYKNEKYLYFGRAAAKVDDAFNLVPSRIAAFAVMLAALIGGLDGEGSFRIWKRDRYNHASPNSAQTESAMAGALGLRLAGPAYYFGSLYDKPYIGDATRHIETEDIRRANNVVLLGSVLALAVFAVVRIIVSINVRGILWF